MTKKKSLVLLIFALCFFTHSQNSIRLGVLRGISCAPCVYLIDNKEKIAVQNMAFQIFDSAQNELPRLLRGELDMAFLPTEAATKVFEKTNGAIVAIGIVQNSNLSLITNDETYSSLENLRGKKILFPSEDYVSREIFKSVLTEKGIQINEGLKKKLEKDDSDLVTLDFSVPVATIASKLISGSEKYAVVTEPFASIAQRYSSENLRAENFSDLYQNMFLKDCPILLLVARNKFASEKRSLINQFIETYKNATDWTKKNPAKAAILAEKHGLGLKSQIVRLSIPEARLTWRNALGGKSEIENLLQILGEKQFPKDEFYFQ